MGKVLMSDNMKDKMKYEENINKYGFNGQSSAAKVPEGKSPGAKTADEVWEQYLNFEPEPFEYDENADPLYQRYMKSYQKNAKAAADDSFARATAASGGFGNSFAAIASQQAYSEQMDKADDIIPELYDYAYSRHTAKQSDEKKRLYDTAVYLSGKEAEAEAAEAEAETAEREAYTLAYDLYNQGYSKEDIWESLIYEGYDTDMADVALDKIIHTVGTSTPHAVNVTYGTIYQLREEGYDDEYIKAYLAANNVNERAIRMAFEKFETTEHSVTDNTEYLPGGKLNNKIQTGVDSVLYTEDDDGNLQLTYDGSQKNSQTVALKRAGYTDAQIKQIFAEADYSIGESVGDTIAELSRLKNDLSSVAMEDIVSTYSTHKTLYDRGVISEDTWNQLCGAIGDVTVSKFEDAADNVNSLTENDLTSLGIDKAEWDEYADDPSAQKELIYNAAAEMVSEGIMNSTAFCSLVGNDIIDALNDAKKTYDDGKQKQNDALKLGASIADAFSLAVNYYEAGVITDEELQGVALKIDKSFGDTCNVSTSELHPNGVLEIRTIWNGRTVYQSIDSGNFEGEQEATIQKYVEAVKKHEKRIT